jgi:alkyl hydroperoxide reductase subunit AhpC
MIELGELERRHEDFARRNARVIVVSIEGATEAQQTQADFPHLLVLGDQERGLSNAAGLIHPHSAPGGGDTSAPTTILVDRRGIVRWLYRPPAAISRLSPDEVLQAVDDFFPGDARE